MILILLSVLLLVGGAVWMFRSDARPVRGIVVFVAAIVIGLAADVLLGNWLNWSGAGEIFAIGTAGAVLARNQELYARDDQNETEGST